MPKRVEDGRPVVICPHCKSDITRSVLVVYPPHPGPDFSGPSVWLCRECGGEWPHEPATKEQEEA